MAAGTNLFGTIRQLIARQIMSQKFAIYFSIINLYLTYRLIPPELINMGEQMIFFVAIYGLTTPFIVYFFLSNQNLINTYIRNPSKKHLLKILFKNKP